MKMPLASSPHHSRNWRVLVRCLKQGFRQPIYPIILAVYVPTWLLSNNLGLFAPSDAIRPVLITIGIAVAVFGIFRCLFRDVHKAAFVATVCIASFFCFGYLRANLPMASAGTGGLIILIAICLIAAFLTFKFPRIWPTATKILNGFMAAMLLLPVVNITGLSMATPNSAKVAPIPVQAAPERDRPNIIHIVLDAYSRADVLRELYGFDNSHFIDSLRKMDFVVPDQATAPYSQTILSMNAIFALDYINDRVASLAENYTDKDARIWLNRDMQNSLLLQTLRSLGYQLINVEGLYRGVHLADVDHVVSQETDRFGISYFEKELLRLTPIHRLMERLAPEDVTYTQVRFALRPHNYNKYSPPFFVYNHIIAPHSPFNFAANGEPRATSFSGLGDDNNRLNRDPGWYEEYRVGYVEKLRYTNSMLLEKIRHLLSNVPDPKVVILHSDHGGGMLLDKRAGKRTCHKERMSAFLAIYASNVDFLKDFPNRINLANLYRILFFNIFGAETPSLPAQSYYSPWNELSAFEEVSESDLESFGHQCSDQRYSRLDR